MYIAHFLLIMAHCGWGLATHFLRYRVFGYFLGFGLLFRSLIALFRGNPPHQPPPPPQNPKHNICPLGKFPIDPQSCFVI